jgi:copper chaperone CopZ
MFRRKFVQLIGVGSLAGIPAVEAIGTHTVKYRVKGFSCVTCAVGLDAMLQKQKGVASSLSSYPDGLVVVKFDPKEITDASLRAFIGDMGFTVEEAQAD